MVADGSGAGVHTRGMRRPVPRWALAAVIALGLALGCPVGDDDVADDDAGDDDGAPPVIFECSQPVSLGAPVNTEHSEMGPALSPDGLQLLFSSDRPGGLGTSDLWIATRSAPGEPWGEPQNLGEPVNGAGGQNNPALSPDGQTLVFGGNRNGNYDLWFAQREGDSWGAPYDLEHLNSDDLENKPALSWDGTQLYFKRSDATLVSNLFVAPRDGNGWDTAVEVPGLNDDRAQTDPSPAPEGDVLYFVQGADTEAPFDIFYAVWDTDHWAWPTRLEDVSDADARDEGVSVGPDGREFVMVSNRDDPEDRDLYSFTCDRI